MIRNPDLLAHRPFDFTTGLGEPNIMIAIDKFAMSLYTGTVPEALKCLDKCLVTTHRSSKLLSINPFGCNKILYMYRMQSMITTSQSGLTSGASESPIRQSAGQHLQEPSCASPADA